MHQWTKAKIPNIIKTKYYDIFSHVEISYLFHSVIFACIEDHLESVEIAFPWTERRVIYKRKINSSSSEIGTRKIGIGFGSCREQRSEMVNNSNVILLQLFQKKLIEIIILYSWLSYKVFKLRSVINIERLVRSALNESLRRGFAMTTCNNL